MAVEGGDEVRVLRQGRGADGGNMLIAALRQGFGIGVMDPAGDHRAQAQLRRRRRAALGIAIVIHHRGAARRQQLIHAQAGEQMGFLRAQAMALRDARRVGRREADVLDHPAHDRQRRVIVDIDQAGHQHPVAPAEGAGGGPLLADPVGRADIEDAPVGDRDRAVGLGSRAGVQGQDQTPPDDEITGFHRLKVREAAQPD
jgi:hypothetical protein